MIQQMPQRFCYWFVSFRLFSDVCLLMACPPGARPLAADSLFDGRKAFLQQKSTNPRKRGTVSSGRCLSRSPPETPFPLPAEGLPWDQSTDWPWPDPSPPICCCSRPPINSFTNLKKAMRLLLPAPLAPIKTLRGRISSDISLMDRKPLISILFNFGIVLFPKLSRRLRVPGQESACNVPYRLAPGHHSQLLLRNSIQFPCMTLATSASA